MIARRRELATGALLLVAGAVAVVVAGRSGGAPAALLAAAAVGCALGLVLWRSREEADAGALLDAALLGLPGALTIYLAFDSGGYFPAAPAVADVVLLAALVLRVALAEDPFEGFSRPVAVAAGGLSLLLAWQLLSATWSDATGRALLEADRTLVYLLAVVLMGSIPRTPGRLRRAAGGVAAGIAVVAVAALLTRCFRDTFPTTPNLGDGQLSFPLTYSNALGLFCVIGGLLSLAFASATDGPAWARVAASAALPPLFAAGWLADARAPVIAGAIGVVVFVVLGRPRGLPSALLAAGPGCAAVALVITRSDALMIPDPPAAAATTDGHHLAIALLAGIAAAIVLRALLLWLDAAARAARAPRPLRRRSVGVAAVIAALLAVVALALAAGAPGAVRDQWHLFKQSAEAGPDAELPKSAFESSARGLIDNWDVALQAFSDQPLHGQGAGTYETYWYVHRPADQASYNVVDGHSLYLEVLGELGVVGAAALLLALVPLLLGMAPFRRATASDRVFFAGLFAAAVAWALHAGIDWDWEMPAVSLWVFALGGAALAARSGTQAFWRLPETPRLAAGLALLAVAVAPALVFTSQRRLDAAVSAFYRGDCTRAIDRAAASVSALPARPEPYEVLAACQSRRGNNRLADGAIDEAVNRDPHFWRWRYSRMLVHAAAGEDLNPDLRAATALNPLSFDIAAFRRGLAEDGPDQRVVTEPELVPVRSGRR